MRADEVHQEDGDAENGARTGPRHAAPRKPLFTRLQMPAGKAIALAAMPTAVLMGMGLTPTLAQAKPLPKNPFQDGPCVTQPDESSEPSDDASGEKKDTSEQSDKDKAKDKSDAKDKATPSPSASATPSPSASPKASSSGDASPSPSASGDDSSGGGLLGGLGSALGGLLTPEQKAEQKESASATPSPSASGESKGSGSAADKVTGAVGDTVDKVTGTAKDVAGDVDDTVGKATDKAKKATEPSPSASDPLAADENGKKPFPCVEEKKSNGADETSPVPLPNQPWYLDASSLLLQGLHYEGVVNLTPVGGETKQALKFTAKDGIDIGDLHQTLAGPDGTTIHVQAAKGSTSTIRGGTVTLYTESLSGNLFGLIPITFDAEHPPPIDLPTAYFTNVKLRQAGQFGGNLTVPGLHTYFTK